MNVIEPWPSFNRRSQRRRSGRRFSLDFALVTEHGAAAGGDLE